MKLAQPKIRDTEEGPEPAAPPRAEGVVPLPRSERGGSGTAAQGEIPCQPRRASCSWMRISVAPKSATRFFSWSMTAGGALATKASLPSLALALVISPSRRAASLDRRAFSAATSISTNSARRASPTTQTGAAWAASAQAASSSNTLTSLSLARFCSTAALVRRNCASSAELATRSEEHTSELQSQSNLVCRLLLEKKKYTTETTTVHTLLSTP